MQPAIDVAMDVRVGIHLATPASRGLAQAIDLVLLQLLQVILFGVGMVLAVVVSSASGGAIDFTFLLALVLLGSTLVTALAFIWLELRWEGQTPGKRWIGIRVVAEDGTAAGNGAIVVRNVMRLVDILPGVYFVGLVAMLLSEKHQRLGDLAAGTIVVAVEPPPKKLRRWPAGLSDGDVRLLEAWFDRAPQLSPARAEDLARKLVAHLGWTKEGDATGTLQRRCPPEG